MGDRIVYGFDDWMAVQRGIIECDALTDGDKLVGAAYLTLTPSELQPGTWEAALARLVNQPVAAVRHAMARVVELADVLEWEDEVPTGPGRGHLRLVTDEDAAEAVVWGTGTVVHHRHKPFNPHTARTVLAFDWPKRGKVVLAIPSRRGWGQPWFPDDRCNLEVCGEVVACNDPWGIPDGSAWVNSKGREVRVDHGRSAASVPRKASYGTVHEARIGLSWPDTGAKSRRSLGAFLKEFWPAGGEGSGAK